MSNAQFSEQEFGKRLDGMGDLAEGVFEELVRCQLCQVRAEPSPPSHVEVAAAD